MSSNVLHPGAPGRFVRTYERPGRLRVEIAYPGDPAEVRVLDGGRGWRSGAPAEGIHLVSMILQAARMDLPALLNDFRDRVADRGTFTPDGGPALRVLALEVAPGVEVEAAIEVATGWIVRSRGRSIGGPRALEFVTGYADFRTVRGVLVAFHEDNAANGTTTGETVIEKVEFPEALPEATFRP